MQPKLPWGTNKGIVRKEKKQAIKLFCWKLDYNFISACCWTIVFVSSLLWTVDLIQKWSSYETVIPCSNSSKANSRSIWSQVNQLKEKNWGCNNRSHQGTTSRHCICSSFHTTCLQKCTTARTDVLLKQPKYLNYRCEMVHVNNRQYFKEIRFQYSTFRPWGNF